MNNKITYKGNQNCFILHIRFVIIKTIVLQQDIHRGLVGDPYSFSFHIIAKIVVYFIVILSLEMCSCGEVLSVFFSAQNFRLKLTSRIQSVTSGPRSKRKSGEWASSWRTTRPPSRPCLMSSTVTSSLSSARSRRLPRFWPNTAITCKCIDIFGLDMKQIPTKNLKYVVKHATSKAS